jgi:hypothetical protein
MNAWFFVHKKDEYLRFSVRINSHRLFSRDELISIFGSKIHVLQTPDAVKNHAVRGMANLGSQTPLRSLSETKFPPPHQPSRPSTASQPLIHGTWTLQIQSPRLMMAIATAVPSSSPLKCPQNPIPPVTAASVSRYVLSYPLANTSSTHILY